MIADATSKDEIIDALMLYTSLNGIDMTLPEAEQRAEAYLRSNPDDIVDLAIVAYQEDQVIGPPDIVLPQWGKSRIYQLHSTPGGAVRHKVFDEWFESGCVLDGLVNDNTLLHFWTSFQQEPHQLPKPPHLSVSEYLYSGLRLRFRQADEQIEVHHRLHGLLGELPERITDEILCFSASDLRYLPLVDSVYEQADIVVCKLLVTMAGANIDTELLTSHTRQAFLAERTKC